MKSIRILIADDHAIMREGLRLILATQKDFQIVGEAARGDVACRLVEELSPDVVVMDVSMPGMGGAAATKRICATRPDVKVLALSAYEDEVYVRQLLAAGAVGYVPKRTAGSEVVNAVRAVFEGEVYLDPSVASKVTASPARRGSRERSHEKLSEREIEVLRFTAQGFTHKEIANLLCVSIKTVETYKARLSRKLDLYTRAELVQYALAHGWLKNEVTAE